MTDRRDLTMPELALAGPIGVISDTHGLLRPEALAMLEGCDLILHLGDVGARDEDAGILEGLDELAPVHAVRGNIDTAAWAERRLFNPGAPACSGRHTFRSHPRRAHDDPGDRCQRPDRPAVLRAGEGRRRAHQGDDP
ncbi:MAG: metallophosphoesterase family protein [Halomonas sp.]|uniref:metallophosphoesterase family protein n=1 Tax=Halomonas sp. TaxID=1486246 RepID=UPI0028700B69|nr:metallophosphoesterase family protein [Halomonas sp.]MDR9438114.1 metallophosphoesterase family protein [Halomonas sp.]